MTAFKRGDANNDGGFDLTDAIFILDFLFHAGPPPACEEAIDVNGDGGRDLSDAIAVVEFLLLNGRRPPAPFPDCDRDPGASCESSTCNG